MQLPSDYAERVYAGVLGKLIGVYLGRPFEGWTRARVERELGEVRDYVNARMPGKPPIVVPDDDVSGTFTFLRALSDHGASPALTAAQVGQTWLNYLIERQTVLWWGGMGNSTEHTAYMRLKCGVPAPRSGSIALNGQVVAEQIGAQIFIDGWGMVAPGRPALAADLARKAASVSHDGEALHAAVLIAAMEAQAFVERDMDKLFETGLSFIPPDSLIARLISDVRRWSALDEDWRATHERIAATYGYDKYGGNCHVVPNHAIIILSLAYAPDDFAQALMIANTAGWDTDCNSGNVGCLLGIKDGLGAIDRGPVDWRGPVADRLYLPTADGGRCISDAVQEAERVVALGHALADLPYAPPKRGARFHFSRPGAVQGFHAEGDGARLSNIVRGGSRMLALHHAGVARMSTPTFLPEEAFRITGGYQLPASPTLYAGQTVEAAVVSDSSAQAALFVRMYGADDRLVEASGPAVMVRAGESARLTWSPAVVDGSPIAEVGVAVQDATPGTLYLDALTWSGAPDVTLRPPAHNGARWARAWVQACDDAWFRSNGLRVMQDEGAGLLIQGERGWRDYAVRATVVLHMAQRAGIAACVQGTRRYYALLLCDDGMARLVKALDGERVLAETAFAWALDGAYDMQLNTAGERLTAMIDGRVLFDLRDDDRPLNEGAVALVIAEGRLDCAAVAVRGLPRS
ncbi:MAG: ADP-ribosylglycohydrolase family protein [Chloroflexi bacterium]|nr:ADP-ribosylglycohydrolase family protein [Chloroflexota bacterium]